MTNKISTDRIPMLTETNAGAVIWLVKMHEYGLEFHYDDLPENAGAVIWLAKMHECGLEFHYDDLPENVYLIATGERTFTDAEATVVSNYVDRIFELLDDPFAIICQLNDC